MFVPPLPAKPPWTTSQAAHLIGTTTIMLSRWISAGRLKRPARFGQGYLWYEADIESARAFVRSLPRSGRPRKRPQKPQDAQPCA
jgi:hypothetical protein